MADQKLGEVLDWQPPDPPHRSTLAGTCVRLEPIDPERHAASLFAASTSDPHLWDFLHAGPFADFEQFDEWLESRAVPLDPLFFAIVDPATGAARGMASYMRITPGDGVIEIGSIWFGPSLRRTRQATEAIFLLARHVFDDLGYRRLEWKCDALNGPSRRAAERFGFAYEGTFRQHMVVKGRSRDTAWFAMIDRDWPVIRAAFQRWLSPENFDADGRQLASLSAIRASLQTSQ